MKAELIYIVESQDALGEGIQWRSSDQTVWWTDIEGSRLHCLSWPDKVHTVYALPHRLASFSFIENSDSVLLAAFDSGMAYYWPKTERLNWLHRPHELQGDIRLNDGRTDPGGRFWVGSMMQTSPNPGERAKGQLFCMSADGSLQSRISEIVISNGICWSPQGDVMYYSDSAKGEIYKAAYDVQTGQVSSAWKVFAKSPDGVSPDGAVTDKFGALWSASWGGACIYVYTPDGLVKDKVDLEVSCPTCVAFGGVDRDLLFISSARQHLSAEQQRSEPNSGNVFVYSVDSNGYEGSRYMAEEQILNEGKH